MTLTKKGFEYRDSDHSYFMDGKRMTGCTTILGVLNKHALVPWAAKMAVEYIYSNSQFYDNIAGYPPPEAGGEVQDRYLVDSEVLELAKTAYAKKRDEGAQKGTDTHALVEKYINYCIEFRNGLVTGETEIMESSYDPIIPFIKWAQAQKLRFISSEEKLYSKSLFIAGTADFIFLKEGKFYVGDIKTYKKIWDRIPMYQCAGYALMNEEMGRSKISGYCIFNLPKERAFKEEEDVLWSFDTEGDTKAFLACVEIYRQNANFKPNYAKIK